MRQVRPGVLPSLQGRIAGPRVLLPVPADLPAARRTVADDQAEEDFRSRAVPDRMGAAVAMELASRPGDVASSRREDRYGSLHCGALVRLAVGSYAVSVSALSTIDSRRAADHLSYTVA